MMGLAEKEDLDRDLN